MRRKALMLSLAFGLTALAACGSATRTCTATGLTPGKAYSYSFVSNGAEYSGEFLAESSSYTIPDVPSSIDCANIQLEPYIQPYPEAER